MHSANEEWLNALAASREISYQSKTYKMLISNRSAHPLNCTITPPNNKTPRRRKHHSLVKRKVIILNSNPCNQPTHRRLICLKIIKSKTLKILLTKIHKNLSTHSHRVSMCSILTVMSSKTKTKLSLSQLIKNPNLLKNLLFKTKYPIIETTIL